MKIAALDIATHMGVAIGNSGGHPRAWTCFLGDKPDARRFQRAMAITRQMMRQAKPELVVIEAPIGGRQSSQYLVGLVACVEGVLWEIGSRPVRADIGTVRKHFLGRAPKRSDYPHLDHKAAGLAIKAEVLNRCRVLGWDAKTDDEADAMAIWDWACMTHALDHTSAPHGELFGALRSTKA